MPRNRLSRTSRSARASLTQLLSDSARPALTARLPASISSASTVTVIRCFRAMQTTYDYSHTFIQPLSQLLIFWYEPVSLNAQAKDTPWSTNAICPDEISEAVCPSGETTNV